MLIIRQAITWTNDGLVLWRIYAWLGLNDSLCGFMYLKLKERICNDKAFNMLESFIRFVIYTNNRGSNASKCQSADVRPVSISLLYMIKIVYMGVGFKQYYMLVSFDNTWNTI